MKKTVALLLCMAMILGLLSGCGKKNDNSAYVPTGDALVMEGQDPEDFMPDNSAFSPSRVRRRQTKLRACSATRSAALPKPA